MATEALVSEYFPKDAAEEKSYQSQQLQRWNLRRWIVGHWACGAKLVSRTDQARWKWLESPWAWV